MKKTFPFLSHSKTQTIVNCPPINTILCNPNMNHSTKRHLPHTFPDTTNVHLLEIGTQSSSQPDTENGDTQEETTSHTLSIDALPVANNPPINNNTTILSSSNDYSR